MEKKFYIFKKKIKKIKKFLEKIRKKFFERMKKTKKFMIIRYKILFKIYY